MKKKNLIAIFILCFAVTAGAIMPRIVLSYHDKRFESNKEKYEMEKISFITDNTLFDAMNLLGEKTKFYEIKNENTKHTRKEIYAEALSMIKTFNEYMNLIDTNTIKTHKEIAMYCVEETSVEDMASTGSTDSIFDETDASVISVRQVLIWRCTIMIGDRGNVDMYMDDSTGKMIGMYICFDDAVQDQGDVIGKYLDEADKIMQKFCSSYYGVQTETHKKGEKNYVEANIIMTDDISGKDVETRFFMDTWSLNFNIYN